MFVGASQRLTWLEAIRHVTLEIGRPSSLLFLIDIQSSARAAVMGPCLD